MKVEGQQPSTSTPPSPPLTATQQEKEELQEQLRRQQDRLAELERQEAAELEAAIDYSRREYLLQQLDKVLSDDHCAQVTKHLAEMIILEHKITSSHFTNWDDRFYHLERRVDHMAAQQSKILDAIQNSTAQLSTAKLIASQLPLIKPKPSPPSTPPSSRPGSVHSSQTPPQSQRASGKATYAAVTAGDQRGPKIPAPNKFRGDDPKTDVGDWDAGTRAYLRGFVCPEQTKVATVLGLLEGPAQKWATSTSSSLQQTMEDWALGLGVDRLLQALEDRFADKERARKAADRIARLGQQRYSGSLQSLFAEFEQLTSTPGLVMSADDLLTNFCRAAPEKFSVALYSVGHKDWRRSFMFRPHPLTGGKVPSLKVVERERRPSLMWDLHQGRMSGVGDRKGGSDKGKAENLVDRHLVGADQGKIKEERRRHEGTFAWGGKGSARTAPVGALVPGEEERTEEERFFWKEMWSDMLRYVDTCELCQRNKVHRRPPLGLLKPLPIPDGPAESVAIVFTDLGKTTPHGMCQVMVCVDRFSKYAEFFPLREVARVPAVRAAFSERWVTHHGPPTPIVSDRDPRFCSDEWPSYCKDYLHSRLDMTYGHHPEANGQAEVMNQVLFQLLRPVISPDQQGWDLHLARAQLMYNMSVHSSTEFSPCRLHWGREPRQPLDDIIDKAKPDLTPGTAEFTRRYRLDVERACADLFKAQKAMVEQANRHRRPSPIRTSDYVWVANSELSREEDISPKLLPRYLGPRQVLDIVGADPFGPSYVIDIPLHLRTYPVFHASKLLPFTPADAFPDRPPQFGPPIPGKGYDVEWIEDEWGTGPDRQYFVRFAFQPPSENRWFYRRELLKTPKYDVHFYASFALIYLFPKLELSLQRDMARAILEEVSDEVMFLAGGELGMRKVAGCMPHDMGISNPWIRLNAYNIHDTSRWKDLNSKFVLQVYRDYVVTGDMGPAQGPSAYCGGLWIAALQAAAALSEAVGDMEMSERYASIFLKGREAYVEKLWNGRYFNYDSSQGNGKTCIQADQMAGQWYTWACGLRPLFEGNKAQRALETVFNNNVMKFCNGRIGAVNGMYPNGKVDSGSMQSREVWTGVTYGVAAAMIYAVSHLLVGAAPACSLVGGLSTDVAATGLPVIL
ncbi:hypothetical protein CBR_g4628 [Chara braunii]|uniref:Integrase catalytic domain-containing protein n=1 Tax=Chara braunii TaxID=69332 RepID=A0A388KID2_CHABU|nr:hypothetical protein CBR_g4628 [Chara braunii]|eukprot:GBG69799.1 hypothetical protein CBR_g4628 [Chara braunii]